jgi:hypothetical protein
MDPFEIDMLERRAEEHSGLSDFGPVNWRDAAVRLLCCAKDEAQLNQAGRNEGDPRIALERANVRAMPRDVLDMHLSDAEEDARPVAGC